MPPRFSNPDPGYLKEENEDLIPFLRPKRPCMYSNTSYKRPFKTALLNLKTCIQMCSTVLIHHLFFLCVGVDTAIQ